MFHLLSTTQLGGWDLEIFFQVGNEITLDSQWIYNNKLKLFEETPAAMESASEVDKKAVTNPHSIDSILGDGKSSNVKPPKLVKLPTQPYQYPELLRLQQASLFAPKPSITPTSLTASASETSLGRMSFGQNQPGLELQLSHLRQQIFRDHLVNVANGKTRCTHSMLVNLIRLVA